MTSSITCPRCGRTSHNANDVRERYCGACHVFHGDAHPALAPYAVEVFRLDGGGLVATFPFRSFDEAHAGMRRLAQERRGHPEAEGYQVVRTDAPPGSTGLTRDEQERADALSEAIADLAEVAAPATPSLRDVQAAAFESLRELAFALVEAELRAVHVRQVVRRQGGPEVALVFVDGGTTIPAPSFAAALAERLERLTPAERHALAAEQQSAMGRWILAGRRT